MNQPNTILFLVNPFAGTGNALNAANYAIVLAELKGYDTEILVTKEKGDLSKFTHLFKLEKISKIAVMGGDGTVHEVVNAIMQNQQWLKIPIVIFPCGTGNTFNYEIGCLTVKKAAQLLLNGKVKLIDLCEVKTNGTTIWSFNSIGCGAAAHINKLAEELRWIGRFRYTIASFLSIVSKPTITAKVSFNDKVYDNEYILMIANNNRFVGKAMIAAPFAKLNDGLIDFILLKKSSRFKLLMLIPKLFNGKHVYSPLVKLVQTNHIKIETDSPQLLNIDGEVKGNTSLEILMFHEVLKVICD